MWWKYIFAADFNVDEMRRIFVAILLLIISQGLLWGQETENMKAKGRSLMLYLNFRYSIFVCAP